MKGFYFTAVMLLIIGYLSLMFSASVRPTWRNGFYVGGICLYAIGGVVLLMTALSEYFR